MEKILVGIDTLGREVDQSLTNAINGVCDLEELERINLHVEQLFKDIRNDGVCKADIRTLNSLGLTEVEEKYFSEYRTYTGMDVALEVEAKGNFLTIVVGGVLVLLSAVLGWFVGKFLAWLFDAQESIGKGVTSSQAKTDTNLTRGNKPRKLPSITSAQVKAITSSHRSVIALTNMGEAYYDGTVVKEVHSKTVEVLNYLKSGITKDVVDTIVKDLSKYPDKESVNKHEIPKEIKSYVDDMFKTAKEVFGETALRNITTSHNTANVEFGHYSNASQVLAKLTTSLHFNPKHTNKTDVELTTDIRDVDLGLTEKDRKMLEGDAKGFQDRSERLSAGTKSLTKLSKHELFVVKYIINQDFIYPSKAVVGVIRGLLAKLLSGNVEYQNIQRKVLDRAGTALSKEEVKKIREIVKASNLEEKDKNFINKELNSIPGSDINQAIQIFNTCLNLISAKDKGSANKVSSVRFFKEKEANGGDVNDSLFMSSIFKVS